MRSPSLCLLLAKAVIQLIALCYMLKFPLVAAQIGRPFDFYDGEFYDVCLHDAYQSTRAMLCPPTFTVSRLGWRKTGEHYYPAEMFMTNAGSGSALGVVGVGVQASHGGNPRLGYVPNSASVGPGASVDGSLTASAEDMYALTLQIQPSIAMGQIPKSSTMHGGIEADGITSKSKARVRIGLGSGGASGGNKDVMISLPPLGSGAGRTLVAHPTKGDLYRRIHVKPMMLPNGKANAVDQDPKTGYNTVLNPLFESDAWYDVKENTVEIFLKPDEYSDIHSGAISKAYQISSDEPTGVELCCFLLKEGFGGDLAAGGGLTLGGASDSQFSWEVLDIQLDTSSRENPFFGEPQQRVTQVPFPVLSSQSPVSSKEVIRLHRPEGLADRTLLEVKPHVVPQTIKQVREIVEENRFLHTMVKLEPTIPGENTVIAWSFKTKEPVNNGAQVVLYLPVGMQCSQEDINSLCWGNDGVTAVETVDFTTSESHWILFERFGVYSSVENSLSFTLRKDASLPKNLQITMFTNLGDFILPYELPTNAFGWQTSLLSYDGIDTLIPRRPVAQSDGVSPIRRFLKSSLEYVSRSQVLRESIPILESDTDDSEPGASDALIVQSNRFFSENPQFRYKTMADVRFTFKCSTPLWKGTKLFLRLSGFGAPSSEVGIREANLYKFLGTKGRFDLDQNIVEFTVKKTLFFEPEDPQDLLNNVTAIGASRPEVTLTFGPVELPASLYSNDPSLLVWTKDSWNEVVSPRTPILVSEQINDGNKGFVRSEIEFSHPQFKSEGVKPLNHADVTFKLLPGVDFFGGDEILLTLYGFQGYPKPTSIYGQPGIFELSGSNKGLFGLELSREDSGSIVKYWKTGLGTWNQDTYTLTLKVAPGKLVPRLTTKPIVVVVAGEQLKLPERLSENDGIVAVSGRGNYIKRESIKKCPALGGVDDKGLSVKKRFLHSSLYFEGYSAGERTDLVPLKEDRKAKIAFELVANTEIPQNSTIVITLGGVTRDMDFLRSSFTGNPGLMGLPEEVVLLSGRNGAMFTYLEHSNTPPRP